MSNKEITEEGNEELYNRVRYGIPEFERAREFEGVRRKNNG